jgi:hypothetical protein
MVFGAKALVAILARDFPHITKPIAYATKVQKLSDGELAELASADLIISAAIDYEGDMRLDHWRRASVPPHVCVWVEEFALAGYAIALFGDHTLAAAFPSAMSPRLH